MLNRGSTVGEHERRPRRLRPPRNAESGHRTAVVPTSSSASFRNTGSAQRHRIRPVSQPTTNSADGIVSTPNHGLDDAPVCYRDDERNHQERARCGRTCQSAGPPAAIAALRVLQVRPEDVAEEAEAAQEFGMWPV